MRCRGGAAYGRPCRRHSAYPYERVDPNTPSSWDRHHLLTAQLLGCQRWYNKKALTPDPITAILHQSLSSGPTHTKAPINSTRHAARTIERPASPPPQRICQPSSRWRRLPGAFWEDGCLYKHSSENHMPVCHCNFKRRLNARCCHSFFCAA